MFEKLLTLLIGRRWRSFCGLEREDFVDLAMDALDDLRYEYSYEKMETADGEKFMLGAGETGDQIVVERPEKFTIQVVTAKSNPGVGYALEFFSTEEMRDEMTSGACVVDLQNVTETTRPYIVQFMKRVIERSDHPPWKVTHHVGFRLAVLLRLKIRILWKYWLRTGHETPSSTA